MKIKKTIDVELSIEDLENIIKEHLQKKKIKVDSIRFDVNGHEHDGDFRAEMPLHYQLDKVICSGEVSDFFNNDYVEGKMVHIKSDDDTIIGRISEDFIIESSDDSSVDEYFESELVISKSLKEDLVIERQSCDLDKIKNVHVYMYSESEPYTNDDWKISHDTDGPFDWKVSKGKFRCVRKYYKVIATTDTSLGLPLITESDLRSYMRNHNEKMARIHNKV